MVKKIAIVEDDEAIRENYADVLQYQGYQVITFASREQAMQVFKQSLPDLAIIDIGLQQEYEGGFELCRQLRQLSQTLPIIFLTARNSDFDTISGLRLGADDYLTKDISLAHLSARIAALFRRIELMRSPPEQELIIQQGDLCLDLNRLSVRWKDNLLEVSLTEFWMIHALAKHPGHVKKREQLMNEANIVVDNSTITSHVKRLRSKFCHIDPGFNCIDTVYGMGYRWLVQ